MSDVEQKDIITDAATASVQSIPTQPTEHTGFDILTWFTKAGELIDPWWSFRRDEQLGKFWKGCDHVASAISMFGTKTASIPVRVEAINPSISRNVKEAELATKILEYGSDFGASWAASLCPKTVEEWVTQDNGYFMEVIGPGDPNGQRVGLPWGLASLDSRYCVRTGNAKYPVKYRDIDGKEYRFHRSRVIFAASCPSKIRTMYGVGFCALSRMIQTGQHLTDIGVYEQEKLGSRPHRQMIVARSGITPQELLTAFVAASQSMDNQTLHRYAKNVIVGKSPPPTATDPIEIDIMDLASAPEGFSKQDSTTLGMYLIALALNIPPRWLWPATQTGATKADAMFSHTSGTGGGIGLLLNIFTLQLEQAFNGGFIGDPKFKVIFDYQDDEQDRQHAEISYIRSQRREQDLNTGVIDVRTARQDALENDEITDEQFNRMELKDGRLPNGDDILTLFMSTDKATQLLLALSVNEPLNIAANITEREFILENIEERLQNAMFESVNASLYSKRIRGQQAVAALEKLRKLYLEYKQPKLQEETPEDTMSDDEQPTIDEAEAGGLEGIEGEQPQEEQ